MVLFFNLCSLSNNAKELGWLWKDMMTLQQIPANQVKFIRNYRGIVYSFLKIYHMSPITKLIDGSPHEIAALMNKFTILKTKI